MPKNQPNGCLAALLGINSRPEFGSKTRSELPTSQDEPYPYVLKSCLLTNAEQSFHRVLRSATSENYVIYVKIRLADLLDVRKGTESWQRYFNRINSKHIDFLIAEASSLRPLLAIELDDASHKKQKRRERDDFVDEACEAAGLPILRVPARAGYNAQDLARSIEAAIGAARR